MINYYLVKLSFNSFYAFGMILFLFFKKDKGTDSNFICGRANQDFESFTFHFLI